MTKLMVDLLNLFLKKRCILWTVMARQRKSGLWSVCGRTIIYKHPSRVSFYFKFTQ